MFHSTDDCGELNQHKSGGGDPYFHDIYRIHCDNIPDSDIFVPYIYISIGTTDGIT